MAITSVPQVYMAGPDVFFPDCWALADRKRAICAQHGLQGVFPLDGIHPPPGISEMQLVEYIYKAQAQKIIDAPIVVANLTPWPARNQLAADTGTAYECGFAAGFNAALDFMRVAAPRKVLVCYSNDLRPWSERLTTITGVQIAPDAQGLPRDDDGYMVDTLGRPDNLMMEGGAHSTGGQFIVPQQAGAPADYYTRLDVFEQAVVCAAKLARQRGFMP